MEKSQQQRIGHWLETRLDWRGLRAMAAYQAMCGPWTSVDDWWTLQGSWARLKRIRRHVRELFPVQSLRMIHFFLWLFHGWVGRQARWKAICFEARYPEIWARYMDPFLLKDGICLRCFDTSFCFGQLAAIKWENAIIPFPLQSAEVEQGLESWLHSTVYWVFRVQEVPGQGQLQGLCVRHMKEWKFRIFTERLKEALKTIYDMGFYSDVDGYAWARMVPSDWYSQHPVRYTSIWRREGVEVEFERRRFHFSIPSEWAFLGTPASDSWDREVVERWYRENEEATRGWRKRSFVENLRDCLKRRRCNK